VEISASFKLPKPFNFSFTERKYSGNKMDFMELKLITIAFYYKKNFLLCGNCSPA